jgi:hypothetical protein
VVIRHRSLIFVYIGEGCWSRFILEALAHGRQEVEFQEEMSSERANRSAAVLNLINVVLIMGINHPCNKQILSWGNDSPFVGEIRKFQCP